MDVELRIGGDPGGDELRSLRRWLVEVPEFRGRVSLREAAPGPGEMGGRIEALVLALSGAAERSTEALDRTLSGWLSTRRPRPGGTPTTVQLRIAGGEVVASLSTELDGGRLDASLRAFVDELTALLRVERAAALTAPAAPSDLTAPFAPTARAAPADLAAGETSQLDEMELGLTEAEAKALAEAFDSRAKAETLLRQAALSPESFPGFDGAANAQAFWRGVGRELALGRSQGGRHRLLAAAAAEYPAHPVFQAAAGSSPAR